jgi:pimeloyl-ACP methyl ester carboxylesterase
MVHGFMGGSPQWQLQRDAFSKERKLITIDLPGFGENASLGPVDSIGGFADWVLDEVRAQGIERFHLLGHSMGGMIVQEMIHRSPERIEKLILYGTGSIGALPGRFETIAQSKKRAEIEGPKATARRIAATWFLEKEQALQFENCATIAEKSSAAAISAGLDAMSKWDASEQLKSIRSETLILWGDCDRTYSWAQVEQLWRDIPNANLAVVPTCAHAVHLENPTVFNALVQGFL